MSKKNQNNRLGWQIGQHGTIKEIRVVGDNVPDGNQVMSLDEAMALSKKLELDLIEINPNNECPICRIADYQKMLYEIKKKKKDQEKNQKKTEIKELRFGPNTDEHDFLFKKKHAEDFLTDGNKVKAYVFFKGRELLFKDKGMEMLLRLATEVEEVGVPEHMPILEGNKMIIMFRPKSKKK